MPPPTHLPKDTLRLATAGSVDDGKSTLIGRLLHDTQSIHEDHLAAIANKGITGTLDLALLTDGLRAEREQGITIDVAYRYFSTPHRHFILADTPGHDQYTRNMVTGASTADAAILLIDATKGILPQTRHHATIATLLGVRHLIIAINKMDLAAFAEPIFNTTRQAFLDFFQTLPQEPTLHFIPLSALTGDNITTPSPHTPWYPGPTLLQLLEKLPAQPSLATDPLRLPIQLVLRPCTGDTTRAYAGQLAAGTLRPGDQVMVLPSRQTTTIDQILTPTGPVPHAEAPQSVTLTLNTHLDIGRGDLLVPPTSPATITTHFLATLVWLDAQPLTPNRRYLLKHTTRTVPATVIGPTLILNQIAEVEIQTTQPLYLDLYTQNRHTGSFILIDPVTNATAAAGMVRKTNLPIPPAPETLTSEEALDHLTRLIDHYTDPQIHSLLTQALNAIKAR